MFSSVTASRYFKHFIMRSLYNHIRTPSVMRSLCCPIFRITVQRSLSGVWYFRWRTRIHYRLGRHIWCHGAEVETKRL